MKRSKLINFQEQYRHYDVYDIRKLEGTDMYVGTCLNSARPIIFDGEDNCPTNYHMWIDDDKKQIHRIGRLEKVMIQSTNNFTNLD